MRGCNNFGVFNVGGGIPYNLITRSVGTSNGAPTLNSAFGAVGIRSISSNITALNCNPIGLTSFTFRVLFVPHTLGSGNRKLVQKLAYGGAYASSEILVSYNGSGNIDWIVLPNVSGNPSAAVGIKAGVVNDFVLTRVLNGANSFYSIYLDGELKYTSALNVSNTAFSNTDPVFFGGDANNGFSFPDTTVLAFQSWTRALGPAEIISAHRRRWVGQALRVSNIPIALAAVAPTLTAAIAHNLGSTTVTPRVTFTR
jgi:hypothetical protein